MPRTNLPPFVQVLWDGPASNPKRKVRGYRGWWRVDGKREFGPTQADPMKAHADAMGGRGIAEKPVAGTISARADDWLTAIATRVTADTLAFYRGKLKSIWLTIPKTLPVERVTPAVLRELVRESKERGLGARTIQHCRRTLNALFGWMQRRGLVTANPCSQVDWPKAEDTAPDVLTEAELADCLARITDPWAADLAIAMAYTSLRRAEMARLKTEDVDMANRVFWIRGKTRSQTQPIDPAAEGAWSRLLAAADGDFIVPGNSDKARREKIADTFRRWQRTLKEPRWHPHTLRHSVATIMLRQGASPAAVQRFLRHTSYAMTQRYVHMIAADVRAATSRLRLVKGGEAQSHG